MATLSEQLYCECNSIDIDHSQYKHYMKFTGNRASPEIVFDFNGEFDSRSICTLCLKCYRYKWFNPSELNLWHDLRSMNTIW